MTNLLRGVALALFLLLTPPSSVQALSAVFNGDPRDASTGVPYEILPGSAFVMPGPDGLLGTADDVVDQNVTGDIDLVVRSGFLPDSANLPAPAIQGGRGAVPVGVVGPANAGGEAIPFTVFLSDGQNGPGAPFGHLLAAADMNGVPVIVAAFGDLDADGWVGVVDEDRDGARDNAIEVRELEPIGRAVAIFHNGVARGRVAVHAGLPPSTGGLAIGLCALALTGPYDPTFLDGEVPSGPAIATAFPFLPQRDLRRMIRDRAVRVGPDTTIQNLVQFASIPAAGQALSLDGRSQTTDVAFVHSQGAVSVTFRPVDKSLSTAPARSLVVGHRLRSRRQRVRLVPADRFGNPADPPPGFAVRATASAPARILIPRAFAKGQPITIDSAEGVSVLVGANARAPSGSEGSLTIERNSAVIAQLPLRVDHRADSGRADVRVPSARARTIAEAIDRVTDRNRDGQLIIELAPGIYRENVQIGRSLLLRGAGAERTVIRGDGSTAALTVRSANAAVMGVTVAGGTSGVVVEGDGVELSEMRSWRNLGVGFALAAGGVSLRRVKALQNGGHGLQGQGIHSTLASESELIDNGGDGIRLLSSGRLLVDANLVSDNATGGISLSSVREAVIEENRIANNVGSGLILLGSQANRIAGNMSSMNDEDGVTMDRTSANLLTANRCENNHGYGIFTRRGNDDFAADEGTQPPGGDNITSGNRKGDVFLRPD